MKYTKFDLRKLIAETVNKSLNEQESEKYYGFSQVSAHPDALKMKIELGGPTRDIFTKLEKALGAKLDENNYYLWKGYYEKYTSKGVPGIFGATGKSLGISRGSDPYTYQPLGNDKYRVISGPKASAMGKTFKKKTYKQKETERQEGETRLAASGNYKEDVKLNLASLKKVLESFTKLIIDEPKLNYEFFIPGSYGADELINKMGTLNNEILTLVKKGPDHFMNVGAHKDGAGLKDLVVKRADMLKLQQKMEKMTKTNRGSEFNKLRNVVINIQKAIGSLESLDQYDDMAVNESRGSIYRRNYFGRY